MSYLYSINKEVPGSLSQRITFFDYLFVFVLIIYAGRANTFVSESFKENPIGILLPIVLSCILAIRWEIIFSKQFYILIFCYFIYFIAISIKYSGIHPTIFLNYFFLFFIVYVVVKGLKFNLFRIYEYLLYCLAIIGLLMWGIQIILGGDTLYNYFGNISSIDSFSYVSLNGLNAIFYSIQPTSASLLFEYMPPRNCGFAWEPGGFAVYLCLAIFINLFITNSDSKGKIRFWVLSIALISTQSTTGYAIFTIIILFYYLNKKLNIILLLIPVMITALIFIFSLPFMSNKIVSLVNETDEINFMVEKAIGSESGIAPQRFSSFLIAFRDFYNNPILGTGGISGENWTNKIGANISTISGIGNLLAQSGLIGFLFLIIISFKTSLFFSKYYNYNGKFLFFLIVLFISISYSIILLPLIMSFWMFQLFTPQNIDQKEIKNVDLNTESNLVSP
ncbi:MAG TPA: hypothetical protein VIK14_09120 [Ignavibacteria bacterium]